MNRQRHTARDLAQIAIFTGLIYALGLPGGIQIGSTPVMITFQTLGVMLAGAVLGGRKGFAAVLLFDALVAAGLPLLSNGRGGLAYLTTAPSAGYPWGFLLGATFIGYFTQRMLPRYVLWKAFLITAVGGILLIYAIGVPVSAFAQDLPVWVAAGRATVYLPGDVIKVLVTVLVAQQVHRAYPGLIGRPTRRADPPATDAELVDPAPVARDERV